MVCEHCFRHVGSIEQQIVRGVLAAAADAQDDDQEQSEQSGSGTADDSNPPSGVEQLEHGGWRWRGTQHRERFTFVH